MKIIIFLLGVFLIGCVLCGIASGVQMIQRGFSRLATSRNDGKAPEASPLQHNIAELRELFALYQQGALTQEEFQRLKHHLVGSMESPPNSSVS